MEAAGKTRSKLLKIGSRKSKLALIQTEFVISELKRIYGNKYEFEVITMSTTGDKNLLQPLSQIGSKALFTKELEEALLKNEIDFIVHSLKDLPTSLPPGCAIGSVLKREDPNDVLVLKKGLKVDNPISLLEKHLNSNPSNSEASSSASSNAFIIGTSSLRRVAQLRHHNPGAQCVDVRGNLNTRLAKLDSSETAYSALLLASAGLKRGGFEDRISYSLNNDKWFYAVGQGALAVECRTKDEFILDLLSPLTHFDTIFECLSERTLMQQLEGGCSVPIGVRTGWESSVEVSEAIGDAPKPLRLRLKAVVLSLDGTQVIDHTETMDLNHIDEGSELELECNTSHYTGIVLPRESLPNHKVLKRQFVNSVKLGFLCAGSLKKKGASLLLDEIRKGKELIKPEGLGPPTAKSVTMVSAGGN